MVTGGGARHMSERCAVTVQVSSVLGKTTSSRLTAWSASASGVPGRIQSYCSASW